MKRMKKLFWVVMLLVMIVMPSGRVEAASAKKQALKAYSDFLAVNESNYYQPFAIAYVNNDSIPDLVWNHMLYTYKNGRIIQLVDLPNDAWGYYKKKNVVVVDYAHGNIYGDSLMTYTYFKIKKNSRVTKLYKYRFSSKKIKASWSYENAKGKKISKAKFNSNLKKIVGSKSMTRFKLYKNTAANRAKYLK